MLNRKDGYDIKLVDFGFAEPINHKELVSKAGTPGYIPPEIFKLHPYTDKGDVFSVGVIFYSVCLRPIASSFLEFLALRGRTTRQYSKTIENVKSASLGQFGMM